MATKSDPYGTVEDEAARQARLAAMKRAVQITSTPEQSDLLSSTSSGSGTYTPTTSTGGYAPPPGKGGFAPSGDQLDAMRRAIAATADRNAAYKITSTPEQSDLLSSTSSGSGGYTPRESTGTNISSPATGGSLGSVKPPTGPTTTQITTMPTTTSTGPNTGTLLGSAVATGAGAGAGTGPGPSGVGASPGPSGAGASTIDQGAGAGSLGALTNSITQQLQSIGQSLSAPGTSPDVTGVYMTQMTSILSMLDQQEKQLRADAEKNGTTIDPSTQFSLDKLRENLEGNLKTTREDLNRRGIFDSGIALDLEGKLRKGNASDQAMVLASRFSKLQDELSQGLSSIRSQKYGTVSSFGRDAANAQTTSNENTRRQAYDREQAALQAMLNLRSQLSGEQNQSANRAASARESQLSREFQAQQDDLNRQYGDAQNRAKTAAEFNANKLAYERESALISQRAGSGAYGGGTSTARSTTTARGTQAAQGTGDITQDAINDMRAVFSNANDATAAIKEQMRELAAAGVDIAALVDAANGLGGRRVGTSSY